MPLSSVSTDAIVQFLSIYEDKPWRKRSFYLALRTFWKWVSITYDTPNPFLDRFGNLAIDIPRTPSRLLYTLEPRQMSTLIEAASNARNKAIVSLLADSGGRRNEIINIQVKDVDLERCRIRVWGKGNKEGWLIVGPGTYALISAHLTETNPQGNLFDLNKWGLKSMLNRLEKKTGIHCNPHAFRRGFTTELRRKGLSELDIAELGRWSSTSMVKRYTKAYTFEDAAKRYQAIVT